MLLSKLRRSFATFGCIAAAVCLVQSPALADWPERPVRVIVAYPPGGSSDLPVRALLDGINLNRGTKFIVENRSGGSGLVGLDACAKAPPDGYTFCAFVVSSMCIMPKLRQLPFDITEYETVGRFGTLLNAFSTPLDAPWKTMGEMLEAAKKNPGKYKVGSSGIGTAQHLGEVALMDAAGVTLVHVPYANSAEMITDTLAGRIDLIFESSGFEQYKAGKIRILAVNTKHPNFPELPVVAEAVPGFDIKSEIAIFAPKGTSPEIIKAFSAMMNEAVARDDTKSRLLAVGANALTDTPESMKKEFTAQCVKVGTLVDKFNIKPE